MKQSPIGLMAIAWFRPEEWDQLKTVCADLQETYEEWHANTLAGIKGLGLTEHEVEKVILTFDDLREWKRARGRKIKPNERADLAAKIAKKRNRTRH